MYAIREIGQFGSNLPFFSKGIFMNYRDTIKYNSPITGPFELTGTVIATLPYHTNIWKILIEYIVYFNDCEKKQGTNTIPFITTYTLEDLRKCLPKDQQGVRIM